MTDADHVVAQFKYSYEYEGKMISFKKGEIFQLLNTSNKDWWQVRRWLGNGSCENLYVPANYMKIKKEESSPLYENMADLQDAYKKAKVQMVPSDRKVSTFTPLKASPKLVRTKSNSIEDKQTPQPANGHPGYNKPHPSLGDNAEPEYAIPHSPITKRKNVPPVEPPPPSLIAKEWVPGYALPVPKKRTQSLATDLDDEDDNKGLAMVGTKARKSIPTILENDSTNRQQLMSSLSKQLESSLSKQLSGGSAVPPTSTGPTPNKLAPVPKPRPKSRPKSYCIDDEKPAEISTFKTTNTFGIPEDRPIGEAPPTRRSFKRQDYNVHETKPIKVSQQF